MEALQDFSQPFTTATSALITYMFHTVVTSSRLSQLSESEATKRLRWVLTAEATKIQVELKADADLKAAQNEAKGIEAKGKASASAKQLDKEAEVAGDILLKDKVTGDEKYQEFWIECIGKLKDLKFNENFQAEKIFEIQDKIIKDKNIVDLEKFLPLLKDFCDDLQIETEMAQKNSASLLKIHNEKWKIKISIIPYYYKGSSSQCQSEKTYNNGHDDRVSTPHFGKTS